MAIAAAAIAANGGATAAARPDSPGEGGFVALVNGKDPAGWQGADLDDIVLTRAFTGLRTSMLAPAIRAAGLDPDQLDENVAPEMATQLYGGAGPGLTPAHWTDSWSAGHSVSGVKRIQSVAEIVTEVTQEFLAAGAGTGWT